jgi:RNA polymerase sigma factor (sigma-70 family)
MADPLLPLVDRARGGDRAALEQVVAEITDDVYHLAMRMLGLRAEAEDATQEILIQVVTHLGQFRGDSALRTWVYRIAQRHLMRVRRGPREELATFENIEGLIAAGDARPTLPAYRDAELHVLEQEVRLSCTEAMVLALDRDHRIAWILAEVFELDGDEAAGVLEIEPAAYRKRLSRARERLSTWMRGKCGLVDPTLPCNCRRQIPVAMGFGVVDRDHLQYAGHAERKSLPIHRDARELERYAGALLAHPAYAAPDRLHDAIREVLSAGRFRMFDA